MSKPKKQKFWRLLMLLNLLCLNSCATTSYDICPVYPIAGTDVAEEITHIEGRAFWEWMARINKLRLQLELCRE